VAQFAVMGYPVDHSLSPIIHQLFAEQTGQSLVYEKIKISLPFFEQQVGDFFNSGGRGLNITLPCKERAYAMSEARGARCLRARAANTLWMQEGCLHADNTDGIGFLRDIARCMEIAEQRILVMGAGGAVRGLIGPLLDAHPLGLTIVCRSQEKRNTLLLDVPGVSSCTFSDLAMEVDKQSYDVVINATSASFSGEDLSLPASLMLTKPFCYDLAYDQTQPTRFVAWARSMGCVARDGLGMLIEQAAESFFIWHGIMPDTAPVFHYFCKSAGNCNGF
jgi:shikimate dehydrogenase